MSQEELKSEFKYKLTVNYLKKLLHHELITQEEYKITDRLNAEKYKPKLVAI